MVQCTEGLGNVDTRNLGGVDWNSDETPIGLAFVAQEVRRACDRLGRQRRHNNRTWTALTAARVFTQYQRLLHEARNQAFGPRPWRQGIRYRVAQERPTRYLLQADWRARRTRVSGYWSNAE